MSKKIFAIFTIFFLLITGISVIAEQSENETVIKSTKNEFIVFSDTIIEKSDDFVTIALEGADKFLMDAGKPMLPVVTKIFTYPLQTKIKDIKCSYKSVSEEVLQDKILPAPKAIPVIAINKVAEDNNNIPLIDDNVYTSTDLYPDKWYEYKISCGIDGINVAFRFYPIRYKPLENILVKINDVEIEITTEILEVEKLENNDEYDMVIIAPREFSLDLNPLVEHKNDVGIKTILKTTNSIYRDSLLGKYDKIGRDKQEKIKYFIKYALDNWDIKYILFVGGLKNQRVSWFETSVTGVTSFTNNWHVPVRYTNNDDGWEAGFISDLYYADIYDGDMEFSSWDSNNNNIFAEFNSNGEDTMDFVPDVIIGRLPCRNKQQVRVIVDKIITYETKTYGQEWFNNMVLVGGDTVPPKDGGSPGFYEGEIVTNQSAKYMLTSGYSITPLWVSNGNLKGVDDINYAFDQGAGFFHFSGHANPSTWSTHDLDNKSWFIDYFRIDMDYLSNNEKYPIVVVGGCHNNQFDVTLSNIIKDMIKYGPINYFKMSGPAGRFWYMEWVPDCWSEHLLNRKDKGSIAVIGNTALGYEYVNDYCLEGLGGWIENRFFYSIGVLNIENLGDAHTKAISDYINTFDSMNFDRIDRKTIEAWALFGDPSLKIGGYS